MNQDSVFELLKLSLWNLGKPIVDESVYEEMKKHAISLLPAPVLSSLNLSDDLARKWELTVLKGVSYYCNYEFVQSKLPITVPYVILKGTSAAQYYPYPEYRTMGDIDIMTHRKHYKQACDMLLDNAWNETTTISDFERGRHRTFKKNKYTVEVHVFFASMNDPKKAKTFDDFIVDNITDNHVLPDMINGLVLIDHINQHLEEGLGLRQIIDWMMFVDKCLPDEKWPDFERMVEKTGLKELAVTVTRMCELFLGLKHHNWASRADKKVCHDLMSYVISCGNFGNKLEKSEVIAIRRAGKIRRPILLLKDLQDKGKENWTLAKHPIFYPFSWMWQGIQLVKEIPQIKKNYKKSQELNNMFSALGVKRSDDGLVYYENGKYYKK